MNTTTDLSDLLFGSGAVADAGTVLMIGDSGHDRRSLAGSTLLPHLDRLGKVRVVDFTGDWRVPIELVGGTTVKFSYHAPSGGIDPSHRPAENLDDAVERLATLLGLALEPAWEALREPHSVYLYALLQGLLRRRAGESTSLLAVAHAMSVHPALGHHAQKLHELLEGPLGTFLPAQAPLSQASRIVRYDLSDLTPEDTKVVGFAACADAFRHASTIAHDPAGALPSALIVDDCWHLTRSGPTSRYLHAVMTRQREVQLGMILGCRTPRDVWNERPREDIFKTSRAVAVLRARDGKEIERLLQTRDGDTPLDATRVRSLSSPIGYLSLAGHECTVFNCHQLAATTIGRQRLPERHLRAA